MFIAAIGNEDAHLKNWSLIYPDDRVARLSPAYDLVSTAVYPELKRGLALNLAGSKRVTDVTAASFVPLATRRRGYEARYPVGDDVGVETDAGQPPRTRSRVYSSTVGPPSPTTSAPEHTSANGTAPIDSPLSASDIGRSVSRRKRPAPLWYVRQNIGFT